MNDPPHLLYIGDSSASSLAEKLSSSFNFAVQTARDVDAAMATLNTANIDCVISEFELPENDGFDLLAQIRDSYTSLPVILLVHDELENVARDAFQSGSTDLFDKSLLQRSYEPLASRILDLIGEDDRVSLTGSDLSDDSRYMQDAEIDVNDISTGDLTPSDLQALTKEQLITLLVNNLNLAKDTGTSSQPRNSTKSTASSGGSPQSSISSARGTTTGADEESSPASSTAAVTDLSLSQGDTVLLECSSQSSKKSNVHQELLGVTEPTDKNILLIRYRSLKPDRLGEIADHANQVKVITVGCSQTVPQTVSNSVTVVNIRNPNDVTRLGILSMQTVNQWAELSEQVVVSVDPLDPLFRYKSTEGIFRFLHIYLGKLSSNGAISSFFVDPSATERQHVNTLKPLFDHVVEITSEGVQIQAP